MALTQLPGFFDPVHDAQQTFRALLEASSRPGLQQTTATLTPPSEMAPSCAAAALTLFDLETKVWLQPGLSQAVRGWLLFHTGCVLTDSLPTADFAIIWDVAAMPNLPSFNWGSPAYPELSTSLLLQLDRWTGGPVIKLQGPGIDHSVGIDLPLSPTFWQQWQQMTLSYPLGIDCWCFHDQQVIGLPRTVGPTFESLEQ
ncbi:MAG: phosphonate C-P lyase system protein PhnH [Leptolyngbya sp. SIOISBB]|nr:phosphonate C-P lyase system protein PhnH [Leptolyngbya sp. SIOISBB]